MLRAWNPGRLTALVALAALAASVVRALAGGQDRNFDLIAYHVYLGYSAFADRLTQDFMAASGQGYQSALPFALLYLLDSLGVAPLVNAAIHAALHSVNLVLLFLLVREMTRGTSVENDRVLLVALWLSGAIAPIYWNIVGTSFPDLLACVPVLGGLLLVARSVPDQAAGTTARAQLLVGAALMGLAVAMRVHTVIFATALGGALLLVPFASRKDKAAACALFAGGTLAAWLAAFGYHGWLLYREFGSPVFPFFNGVFRSPDFLAASVPAGSYVPASLGDALTLPFRIAGYRHWVYMEIPLPDVRAGFLVACAAGAGLAWGLRRFAPVPGLVAAIINPSETPGFWTFIGFLLGNLLLLAAVVIFGVLRAPEMEPSEAAIVGAEGALARQ